MAKNLLNNQNNNKKAQLDDEIFIVNYRKKYNKIELIEPSDSDFMLQMSQDVYETQDDDDDTDDFLISETLFRRTNLIDLNQMSKITTKIVKNYLIGDLLGDGSYGKVKECLDLDTLSRRAVKIVNSKIVNKKIPHGMFNVQKEINIMQRLNHKNLIKLYDSYKQDIDNVKEINETKSFKLYIFMDYCMTSIERLIENSPDKRLHKWQAQYYFKQLIDGLDYLHSINIIHNDIKPGNLLIACDDSLKIGDFSISAELSVFHEYEFKKIKQEESLLNSKEKSKSNLVNNINSCNRFPIILCTPMFQCPEMLDEIIDELIILKYATKIDIWSSGVTLYQIVTGELPFHGQTVHQIYEKIRVHNSQHLQLPDFIDKNLKDLISNMLNRDPIKRWSIKQIRDSEWFRKKQPIVKEELALLPQDVLNNELNSFRMINYLEQIYSANCTKTNTLETTNTFFNSSTIRNNGNLIEYLQNGRTRRYHKSLLKYKQVNCSLM